MIDPAQKLDRQADLLIRDGLVEKITEKPLASAPAGYDVVNATGLVVAPGFVDLHTHLREPGFEYKETISSGGQAAARGGFTTICAMPNTEPPLDTLALSLTATGGSLTGVTVMVTVAVSVPPLPSLMV